MNIKRYITYRNENNKFPALKEKEKIIRGFRFVKL